MYNQLRTETLWLNRALADGECLETAVFDLNTHLPAGYFSLQLAVAGVGTVAVVCLVSNDGVTYLPFADGLVYADFGAAAGPNADGHDLVAVQPPVARYMQFALTATGAVTVSGTLCIQ